MFEEYGAAPPVAEDADPFGMAAPSTRLASRDRLRVQLVRDMVSTVDQFPRYTPKRYSPPGSTAARAGPGSSRGTGRMPGASSRASTPCRPSCRGPSHTEVGRWPVSIDAADPPTIRPCDGHFLHTRRLRHRAGRNRPGPAGEPTCPFDTPSSCTSGPELSPIQRGRRGSPPRPWHGPRKHRRQRRSDAPSNAGWASRTERRGPGPSAGFGALVGGERAEQHSAGVVDQDRGPAHLRLQVVNRDVATAQHGCLTMVARV